MPKLLTGADTINAIDAIWHPFRALGAKDQVYRVLKAKREFLYLHYKNKTHKLIDGTSSWWLNIHGHSNPSLGRALRKQSKVLQQVCLGNFFHDNAAQLSKALALKFRQNRPHENFKVFFSDNGSTAVEVALKMAAQYHQMVTQKMRAPFKNKKISFVALKNAYHGDTIGAMSVSQRGPFTKAFEDYLFDVSFIDPRSNKSLAQFKALCRKFQVIFIFEPLLQGAGGMKIYSSSTLDKLLEVAHQYYAVTIADEVLTGNYRLGTFLACDKLHHKPQITCLSKGITGGYMPLGLTVVNDVVYQKFMNDQQIFYHGHSYSGNALACALALQNLKLTESIKFSSQLEFLTQQQRLFCEKIIKNPNIKNARSIGTIFACEILSTQNNYQNSIKYKIFRQALELGLYLRPLGNTLYFMPPLNIRPRVLAKAHAAIEAIISSSF